MPGLEEYELIVYVPTDPDCGIYPGSGVVGHPLLGQDGRLLVYFEGGIYGQSGFEHFEFRLFHAASRLLYRAPTIARMVLPAESLESVGTYNLQTRRLVVHEERTLEEWIARWKPRN